MIRILVATLFAVFATVVNAQEKDFYVGGHYGQSKARSACDGLTGVAGVTCDDTDTAWKLLGGYRINESFAAEVGYVDLGEAKASGPGGTATIKAKAYELVGVGSLPLYKRMSVYAKLGAYHGQATGHSSTRDASDSSTEMTFGAGVRWDFPHNIAARIEWQRYDNVGGSNVGKSDIDVMSLGVLYRF